MKVLRRKKLVEEWWLEIWLWKNDKQNPCSSNNKSKNINGKVFGMFGKQHCPNVNFW